MTPSRSPMGSRAGSSRGGSPLAALAHRVGRLAWDRRTPRLLLHEGRHGHRQPVALLVAARRPPPSSSCEDPLLARRCTAASSAGKSAAPGRRDGVGAHALRSRRSCRRRAARAARLRHAPSRRGGGARRRRLSRSVARLPRPRKVKAAATRASFRALHRRPVGHAGACRRRSAQVPARPARSAHVIGVPRPLARQASLAAAGRRRLDDEAASPPQTCVDGASRRRRPVADARVAARRTCEPAGMSVGLARVGMIMGGARARGDDAYLRWPRTCARG